MSIITDKRSITDTLPDDLLQEPVSYLNVQEQAAFARTCKSAAKAVKEFQTYFKDQMAPLRETVFNLPPNTPLSEEIFKQHFSSLVAFPANTKDWQPIFRHLLQYLPQSWRGTRPWHIHNLLKTALEESEHNLSSERISAALEAYFSYQVEKQVYATDISFILSGTQNMECTHVEIDPRSWFGLRGYASSLWGETNRENDLNARIPQHLLKALWARLQSLYDHSSKEKPFVVSMTGRSEAELPMNFTLELAKLITDAGMYLDHNNTVDTRELTHPEHTRWPPARETVRALYPNAIVNV